MTKEERKKIKKLESDINKTFNVMNKIIDKLEAENAELKADNDARKFAMAMSEKVEEQWQKEKCELIETIQARNKAIQDLEAQIEKMKCCYNCRHSRTEYEHCKTDKHEKWEIKENG